MGHTRAEFTLHRDSDLIECKVVKVLSSESVALDAGKSDGVKSNMIFYIYGYEVIREPQSSVEIETLEYVKARVKVSLVGRRVCVADTFNRLPSAKLSEFLSANAPKWHEDVKIGDQAKQHIERA
ncbi:MAG: hypothetical protein OXF50_06530 [Caldilineaceae bacterium]|nr:hypothetical protein [Caldilineaceae bacterium]